MKIIFSEHALHRMWLRGIEKSTVLFILRNPDFVEKSFSGRKIAHKKLDKLWKVVFREEKSTLVVLTVFFD